MKNNARKFMTSSFVLLLMMLSLSIISCRANSKANAVQEEEDAVFSGRSLEAYYLPTDIPMYSSITAQTPMQMKLYKNRVCVNMQNSGDDFVFPQVDCVEYLTLGEKWIKYYEPAQDFVEPHYIKRAVFDQSAQKKRIYLSAPNTWKDRETYTFVPQAIANNGFIKITITPFVIKDPNATMKQLVDNDRTATKKVSMKDVMVYKLSIYYKFDNGSEPIICYVWDGEQFAKNNTDENGDFVDDFSTKIEVDETGYCRWQSENGLSYQTSELSPIEGEYPEIDFFGWIDQETVVLDSHVFVIKK